MERKLYREIWEIRFKKMLDLENKSIEEYQKLLDESRAGKSSPTIIPHLEQLVQDEKKHAKLCEELLAILARQVD